MHWNDAFVELPLFKTRESRLWAWEQTDYAFPISFSQFHPHSSPPPHANEMCQSHGNLLAIESIASVGQMRSRLLPSGLAGYQECPPPPHPLPPPPPPSSPSFPNGSYQTHQEICDRTILKTMRRLPPTSPEVKDYERKCFASVCSVSVHARVLFLHKLNVMGGSLMSPEFKVTCREHKSFCLAEKKKRTRCSESLFIFHITAEHFIHKQPAEFSLDAVQHVNDTKRSRRCTRMRFNYAEKTFHYCSGIFIILFSWGLFFHPFRFVSSPRVYILFTAPSPEFSWKCSVFSTRILWLSNTVLRHKTLKQFWKRQRDGTDKQGHKALEEWGGERWRQAGRKRECVCVLHSQRISGWWPILI